MKIDDVIAAHDLCEQLRELERMSRILTGSNTIVVWAAPAGAGAETVPNATPEFKDEVLMLLSREMLRIERKLYEMGVTR